jgi:hypothetical protein
MRYAQGGGLTADLLEAIEAGPDDPFGSDD